jgi:hypothetical protein
LNHAAPRRSKNFRFNLSENRSKSDDLWHWQTTLVTTDIAALTDRLHKAGGEFITPTVVTVPADAQAELGFKKAVMVRDPTGHALRLVEE